VARKTLNLGILAHVDAGKTTLTERLLYAAGVIDAVGSVDRGTTQADSLELERQRGITIKTAVVSFTLGDATINLIDTPGHPDFIAEVERVLNVLDGAVLVVSAVEGVQPQSLLLMRTLKRLGIPTLLFVNKIDRSGADEGRVLRAIRERLTPAVVVMGTAHALGTRAADFVAWRDAEALAEQVAEQDDDVLREYVEGHVSHARLRRALAVRTREARVHPLFFGSAITGAGVGAFQEALVELLPAAPGDESAPLAATVFKIERGAAGEKIAYVRVFAGTIATRDRVELTGGEAKVTAVSVFADGGARRAPRARAGEIAKVWGLAGSRIGDTIGSGRPPLHEFPPPTLEAIVDPVDANDRRRLRVALEQLAEQDPLIDVRQSDARRELSVSLYGEVQKEVIEATLERDFHVAVSFREATPIYVERPVGRAEHAEVLHAATNPFAATVGLRIEPAPDDSGVEFRLDVATASIPLYVYRSVENFAACMRGYVLETLAEGLSGWRVTDCVVTMIDCAYSSADGPPSRRGPLSMPNDYRRLTPIVLMRALAAAGTVVCEPMLDVRIDGPVDSLGGLLAGVARLGGTAAPPQLERGLVTIETVLPAARAQELHRLLAPLAHGEGVLETSFRGYRPVVGEAPSRSRTTANPLDLGAYLAQLGRGTPGA
jgi:ribosomal protection tetracycline resistance protein